jgi:hypothetical protein
MDFWRGLMLKFFHHRHPEPELITQADRRQENTKRAIFETATEQSREVRQLKREVNLYRRQHATSRESD